MKFLGNIVWLVFGGFAIALEYFLSSIILFVTIIGIPFGIQTVKLGILAIWPFGSEVKKIEGTGADIKAEINFQHGGTKKLLLRFAKLEIIG